MILQDSLTFLWQVNAQAKNNVQALLIGYTTAPPSGRENQITEEFGSVNPNRGESRLLRLRETRVAGKKCECRRHPLLFENIKTHRSMSIKSPLYVLLLRDVGSDLKKNAPTEVCSITVDSGSIWHRSSRLKKFPPLW